MKAHSIGQLRYARPRLGIFHAIPVLKITLKGCVIIHILQMGNCSSGRVCSLPNVTEPADNKAGIQTQVFIAPKDVHAMEEKGTALVGGRGCAGKTHPASVLS